MTRMTALLQTNNNARDCVTTNEDDSLERLSYGKTGLPACRFQP